MLSTGLVVRVQSKDLEYSQKATLAYFDNDLNQWDVIYDAGGEEAGVNITRIALLQPFELNEYDLNDTTDPLILKENGNYLYSTLKDYDCAMNYYSKALTVMGRNGRGKETNSTGSAVLVSSRGGSLDIRPAMISDQYENKGRHTQDHKPAQGTHHSGVEYLYDVIYEEENDTEHDSELIEEEEGITIDRIFALGEFRHRECQRACYLNMARCAVKKGLYGWAVRYASLALAVTEMMHNNGTYHTAKTIAKGNNRFNHEHINENWKKKASDCLFLRGKALLLSGRPGSSKKEGILLSGIDSSKSQQLFNDINAFKVGRHKSDKKLAKAMVSWVQEAMGTTSVDDSGASQVYGDLNIEDIEDVEDDHNTEATKENNDTKVGENFWGWW